MFARYNLFLDFSGERSLLINVCISKCVLDNIYMMMYDEPWQTTETLINKVLINTKKKLSIWSYVNN